MAIVYKAVVEDSERSVVHWRTKGSKNGVRLWQNEDGSYTPAGRTSKPGGRYNQAESHESGSSVSKGERKQATKAKKEEDAVNNKRNKNANYNEKISKTIPYSREDLTDYEKQQELNVMTAQLKYANEMKEYQKKAESTNYKKVGEELAKELTKEQAKLLIGVGVAALAVGGVYAVGGQLDTNALAELAKTIDPTGAVKLGQTIGTQASNGANAADAARYAKDVATAAAEGGVGEAAKAAGEGAEAAKAATEAATDNVERIVPEAGDIIEPKWTPKTGGESYKNVVDTDYTNIGGVYTVDKNGDWRYTTAKKRN